MGVRVQRREGETTDELIARFKTRVKRAGVMNEMKLREFHMNRHERRIMKKKLNK